MLVVILRVHVALAKNIKGAVYSSLFYLKTG
jgi:hypothetical protein